MGPPRKSVIAVLALGVLLVLGTLRGIDLYSRRADVLRVSARRAENLASILSEYLRGTFSAGDASLRQLSLHSQRVGGARAPDADWAPSLASSRAGLTGVGSISVTDARGTILHSTIAALIGQSRADTYVFQRLSAATSDEMIVDRPFLTVVGQKQFIIPVGRRLTTKDGGFDGMVVITFSPAALRQFFRTIDVGRDGAVWVLHPDGSVIVREPSGTNPIGEPSAGNLIFQAAQRAREGIVDGTVTPGGADMLSAFHAISAPPLVLAVSLDRGELLADWRRQAVAWTVGFAILSATMMAMLTVLFRQMDAKSASEEALRCAQLAEAEHLKASNERLAAALAIEQDAHKETEAAARLKDEFVMTVSHELRTPLTSITGWVQLLEMGRLNEAQSRAAIETISRSARVQARLVDDLLDVSRIISGKLRLELREMNAADMVHDAVAIVQPAADAKTIRLDVVIDPETGIVTVDPDRLQQVVWNLLSNAIKFTPAGGRVVVSLQRSADRIEIAVRDSGQGISADFLPHVFERFRQSDSGSQRRHGGLGLGLAIARHLVELHGGTVTAESAGEGRGATFRVELPVRRAAPSGDVIGGPQIETALS
jgi:signal transduction histidine kinase